jgi:tripartite-type tricarboxylate transporter receptor subunit TctC
MASQISKVSKAELSRRAVLGLGLGAVLMPIVAGAQAYPSRPVTIVVPFGAGGTGDIVARAVAPLLAQRLGGQVIVDNKPGAGGAIGWAAVANSPKDGYTLLATDTSFAMAAAVIPKQPFDPRKDFVHVGTTATSPFILVASPTLPVKTLPELVQFAKSNPGKINYGSGGNGSSSHLGGEWFKSITGTSMVHVPYRGGSAVVKDLIGGQVDVAFLAVPSVLQHVRAGSLKALVVSSERRIAALPDVPSAAQAGVEKFIGVNWFGISAPAGTPGDVIARLNTELNTVLNLPDMKSKLAALGLDAAPAGQKETVSFVDDEINRWSALVKAANIKPE